MTDELGYELDQNEYDWLVLGTGFEETLYSAHLAKMASQSVLVVDFHSTYSSNFRSMNFREYAQVQKDIYPQFTNIIHKTKIFQIIEDKQYEEKNKEFETYINSKGDFKYFSIDLAPKLIYSVSPTVDLLMQADMDQYMEFRALEGLYYFDAKEQQFKSTPTTKSDIFSSKYLTLQEKKTLFQLLHTLVQLYNHVTNAEIDQNSTKEFDQRADLNGSSVQLFEQTKNKSALEFLDLLQEFQDQNSKNKIYSILFYSICFENYNYQSENSISTKQFVQKVGKFLKSLGVHSKYPFLYPNYGTGDIPQGLCRISSIYGSTFIISNQAKIKSIQLQENQLKVESNMKKEQLQIKKGIIMSPQIYQSYKPKEQQPIRQLLRFTVITTKQENYLKDGFKAQSSAVESPNPAIFIIPAEIVSKHPIYILRLDHKSNTVKIGYEIYHVKTVLDGQDHIKIKEFLIDIIQNLDTKYQVSENQQPNQICHVFQYTQDLYDNIGFDSESQNKIFLTSQDNFDIDLDGHSETFIHNIGLISNQIDGKYILTQNPDKQVKKVEQEDNVDSLLQRIETMRK